MDRASDSDSESQGFDSLHAYCSKKLMQIPCWGCFGFDIYYLLPYDSGRSLYSSKKHTTLRITAKNLILSFSTLFGFNTKKNQFQFAV